MDMTLETIVHAAKQLTFYEKARLVRTLLTDLNQVEANDIDALWIEEANRRYYAFLHGEMEFSPAEEVFARVRGRIRQ